VRVVVDTNVIVAGLVADGICRDIIKRRVPSCELVASQALLDELTDTMRGKFGLEPTSLPLLKLYTNIVTLVNPKPLSKLVCRDKDDDELLAAALAGSAELIVTGDKDLLTLKGFRGIKILSPRQFVEWMDRQK
jgi:uncharacterized protein